MYLKRGKKANLTDIRQLKKLDQQHASGPLVFSLTDRPTHAHIIQPAYTIQYIYWYIHWCICALAYYYTHTLHTCIYVCRVQRVFKVENVISERQIAYIYIRHIETEKRPPGIFSSHLTLNTYLTYSKIKRPSYMSVWVLCVCEYYCYTYYSVVANCMPECIYIHLWMYCTVGGIYTMYIRYNLTL